MLQYLIILLDDASTSYCHYNNSNKERRLIGLDDLRQGIFFAMKENLMIQFIYPDYELPKEYKEAVNTIDHSDIVPSSCADKELTGRADVIVINAWDELPACSLDDDKAYVLRTSKADFFEQYKSIVPVVGKMKRLNVVITDVETFTDDDFNAYKDILKALSDDIERLYEEGKSPQLNILTDRMMLDKMNNCNAGCENITLAPDGKFYVCPAFYLADDDNNYGLGKTKYDIGNLTDGLKIRNPQLYKLAYAPICRHCDAYQCKRCVWLNRKTTYEINTPSHEQCVVSHLERNAGRELLSNIRKQGTFLPGKEIKEIEYLDPYELKDEWK